MTVDESMFLGLGILLGLAAGVALVEILRARPPAPRVVRVTMAQDAVPRRSSTLADDAYATRPLEPAVLGPGDRRLADAGLPPGITERRTPVRSRVAGDTPLGRPEWRAGQEWRAGPPTMTAASLPARSVAVPVRGGHDPVMAAFQATVDGARRVAAGAGTAVLARPLAPVAVLAPALAVPATSAVGSTAITSTGARARALDEEATRGEPTGQDPRGGVAVDAGPCGDTRRLADERCELAGRARGGATAAEERLRAAQRAYDDHEERAQAASERADPRSVRSAKDGAQATFRAARERASTTDDAERAARDWLADINRINTESRDAALVMGRERELARSVAAQLERLAVEADAARISAETAEAACLGAREALAECEEQTRVDPSANQPSFPSRGPAGLFTDEPSPLGVLATDGAPRIFRLLRGERAALTELVVALAGDDQDARRRWQLAVSDLVDAIVADAIDASVFHFPPDHPFWGPFTLTQGREIAAALSSLGLRFDGLGGWADGRIPSQRDLSLALGYAGLDPMRMRHWPTEAEMASLYAEVTVAADEHLASVAGDLTLGELVAMLGRRADGLAEVWNAWGRLRPLLLEER